MEYIVVAAIAFGIGWAIAFRDTSSRERAICSQESAARARHDKEKVELAQQHASSIAQVAKERDALERISGAWQGEYQRLLNETRELYGHRR